METISNTTCTKCQRCGEWTNYADDEHYKAIAARLAESEARAVADARRLDWLMSAMRGADLYFITGTMSDDAATRRTAIDAAIAQEAEREAGSA